ncbi:unnamed protein product [Rotaria sp. Silwood1]|nr:unnamed protein product [Rotaria sp. Silwood1]CAF1682470.1 unnamed protein product [Rotaria sp. Silwood1]
MAQLTGTGGSKQVEELLRDAKPGDMIEIDRHKGLYQHWGVYIGNGEIIHRAPHGDSAEQFARSSEAVITSFGTRVKPSPEEEILERAHSHLGEGGYSLTSKNCEHFATQCRYGQEKSRQVEDGVATAIGIGAGVVVAGSLAAGAYIYHRSRKESRRQ